MPDKAAHTTATIASSGVRAKAQRKHSHLIHPTMQPALSPNPFGIDPLALSGGEVGSVGSQVGRQVGRYVTGVGMGRRGHAICTVSLKSYPPDPTLQVSPESVDRWVGRWVAVICAYMCIGSCFKCCPYYGL